MTLGFRRSKVVPLAVAALVGAGCGAGGPDDGPSASQNPAAFVEGQPYRPQLDPASFVDRIDNPYWPMTPGSRWVYREAGPRGPAQQVVVTVTDDTKEILGIQATVVHDVVSEGGQVTEDTFDWYAQDAAGNIWYLGENTKEFEDGKIVSRQGSWEAGVKGAQPGIIVPANPQPGMTYRQEYYEGHAEDIGQVLSLDEKAQVPFGFFEHTLLTKDFTPLEPKVLEYKLYARDVGPVLVLGVSGGADREDLISYRPG